MISNTAAGSYQTKQYVYLEKVYLPEFHRHRTIDTIKAYVFDAPCNYDIILGRDVLSRFDFDIKYSNNTVTWEDQEVNMKPQHFFRNPVNTASCLIDFMEIDNEQQESFLKEILPSKYGKVETDQVADQQQHLKPDQITDLKHILGKYTTLFNGELGIYIKKKVHLQLHDEVQPFHGKAYPVPFIHKKVFMTSYSA